MTSLGSSAWIWVGLAGQALFASRMAIQWWVSERARVSLVPNSYWWLSVAGTALVLAYAFATRDPIFLLAPLVNLYVYVRNLRLIHRSEATAPRSSEVLIPVALALATFAALAWLSSAEQDGLLVLDTSSPWTLIGAVGTGIWTSRYIVQWWAAERSGKSVLPASFWWVSTAGSVLLFAYAVHKVDWVFILAHGFSPIPYVRNLILIQRNAPASSGDFGRGAEAVEE